MNIQGTVLSSQDIVETLFNFVKANFDKFEHAPKSPHKWWHNTKYGRSWAPFVEACFIIWGEELNKSHQAAYIIGHTYSHPNISTFMKEINHPYGTDIYPKFPPRLYDVSWVNEEGKLILALEHEESENNNHGSIAENQLYAIFEELKKLRYYKGEFKIIVSRPHNRNEDNGNYDNLINDFKNEIQTKLSSLSILPKEKWIIILIAPGKDIKRPGDSTHIKFHCYEWMQNDLQLIEGSENCSFEVEMYIGGYVKCKQNLSQN
jgi:hypothetical protein